MRGTPGGLVVKGVSLGRANGGVANPGKTVLVVLLIILALGFWLRVFRLYDQSYWGDEVVSLVTARNSPAGIVDWVKSTEEPHPPLYYLMLHYWIRLVGENELATRYLSAAFGTAAVALIYVLGRLLLNARVGLVGALLLATNPLNVLQSRDTRMYSILVCLALLSTTVLVLILRQSMTGKLCHRATWFSVYGIASLIGLFVHYNFGFVLATHVLFLVVLLRWRFGLLRPWLVAWLAISLAYAPWLLFAGGVLFSYQGFTWSPTHFGIDTLAQAFWTAMVGFGGADALVGELWPVVATVVIIGLLLLGLVSWGRRGFFQFFLLAAAFFVPILGVYVASLRRPIFQPRYLIGATPAFLLLLAGVCFLLRGKRRWAPAFSAALLLPVLVSSGFSLSNSFFDPNLANADYRTAAERVQRNLREEDGFVFGHSGVKLQFTYYFGREPLHYLPPGKVEGHEGEIETALTEVLRVFDRVWFIPYWKSDIDLFIGGWLDQHAYKVESRWAGKVNVILYSSPRAEQTRTLILEPIRFGSGLSLDSVVVGASPVEPEEAFDVSLDWQVLDKIGENLKVNLRLTDEDGHVYGEVDRRPLDQATVDWLPGQRSEEHRGLPVALGTPPGEYSVELGVYRERDGQPVDFVGSDGLARKGMVELGKVQVSAATVPARMESIPVSKLLNADLEDIRLLAVSVDNASAKPGERVALTVYWQAKGQMSKDYAATVRAVGASSMAGELVAPMVGGRYPTTRWATGEVIRDHYELMISPKAAAGSYEIKIGLSNAVDAEKIVPVAEVSAGRLRVEAKERRFVAPTPARVLITDFEGTIRLLGYDFAEEGTREVKLTLYWQALRETAVSYTVFIHLLDSREKVWGQSDSLPASGAAPTTGWIAREVTTDQHRVPLRPGAPAGRYTIEIGLYDATTGTRLKLGNGEDRLILQEVSLYQPGP